MLSRIANRLFLAFLIVLLLMSGLFIGLVMNKSPMFLQELNQNLNLDLAKNIVKEKKLIIDKQINRKAMKAVLNGMMLVNPGIEIYITDTQGKLLAFSAPEGVVKKDSINMQPVQSFLQNKLTLPVMGDDPRSNDGKKVFSAAEIKSDGELDGYLYVVLGGQQYDSVVSLLEDSYLLRSALWTVLFSLVGAAILGFFLFRYITRRVELLSETMETFKQSDFTQSIQLPERFDGRKGDEIDKLGSTFSQMSERIIQQVKQLQHNDKSRRELVANVSHDLRTPLASLQGYLETLMLKKDSLSDDEYQQYVKTAFENSQRLQKLISELFELARLENDNAQLHFEAFSISELAQVVSQKFKLNAEKKGIKIETHIPKKPVFVSADIGLIQRVLENLIDNAIKYTPEGGEVEVELNIGEDAIVTVIKDNGLGISEEEAEHIFDRFYRVEKHRNLDGTGLGLAIVKRIMQLHDSQINVSPAPGSGTMFSFGLPVAVL